MAQGTVERYYFPNNNNDISGTSIEGPTPQDRKIAVIRDCLCDMVMASKWERIQGTIQGVYVTDESLCKSMLTWTSEWDDKGETFMHEILQKSQDDPPIYLLEFILFLAPDILKTSDLTGDFPLHYAIRRSSLFGYHQKSLDIIKFLVEADKTKATLRNIMTPVAFRNDVFVFNYFLQFAECRRELVGRAPLRWHFMIDKNDREIPVAHKALLEATARELGRPDYCCLLSCIEICSEITCDVETLRQIASRQRDYHCSQCASKMNKQNKKRKSNNRKKQGPGQKPSRKRQKQKSG